MNAPLLAYLLFASLHKLNPGSLEPPFEAPRSLSTKQLKQHRPTRKTWKAKSPFNATQANSRFTVIPKNLGRSLHPSKTKSDKDYPRVHPCHLQKPKEKPEEEILKEKEIEPQIQDVEVTEQTQNAWNAYGVWRYDPRDGKNDSSVTGGMVMALKSAQDFKLVVDKKAFSFASAWYDMVTDPNTGQCGYRKRGEGSAQEQGQEERFPANKTEAMTAVGLFARFWLGQDPEKNSVMLAAADTILKKPPIWNRADGSIDLYYWNYSSYAMFQVGGRKWKRWKRSLEKALLPSQIKKGHASGSWNPVGAWGESGGRVYTTALCVLTLEVYFRYSRLLR